MVSCSRCDSPVVRHLRRPHAHGSVLRRACPGPIEACSTCLQLQTEYPICAVLRCVVLVCLEVGATEVRFEGRPPGLQLGSLPARVTLLSPARVMPSGLGGQTIGTPRFQSGKIMDKMSISKITLQVTQKMQLWYSFAGEKQ